MNEYLIHVNDKGQNTYQSTTLDLLEKSEEFLESIIFQNPQLLNFESKESGIYGPYSVYRQLNLNSPQGRTIFPDIVILAASGHVIIVEVKLSNNPELRDRRVVAQAIEYAAVIGTYKKKDLVELFNNSNKSFNSWAELIKYLYPKEDDYEDLALTLYNRIINGQVNIIIVCDKAPEGLYEIISSVVNQESLDFKLEVKEILPFVNKSDKNDIIFYSISRYETQLIAKTTIEVTYKQGETPPNIEIYSTSVEEIEKNIDSIRSGRKRSELAREWSDEELDEYFLNHDINVIKRIYDFCKRNSADGIISTPGAKVNPVFGLYLKTELGRKKLLNCIGTSDAITIYFNMIATLINESDLDQFKLDLKKLFPELDIENAKEPSIKIEDISKHINEFLELLEKFLLKVSK